MKSAEFADRVYSYIKDVVDEKIQVPDHTHLFFDTGLALKMLTKRRIQLLKYLEKEDPDTLQELAMLTKRKKQAINRDLRALEAHNIVKLERNGRTAKPRLQKKFIVVALV